MFAKGTRVDLPDAATSAEAAVEKSQLISPVTFSYSVIISSVSSYVKGISRVVSPTAIVILSEVLATAVSGIYFTVNVTVSPSATVTSEAPSSGCLLKLVESPSTLGVLIFTIPEAFTAVNFIAFVATSALFTEKSNDVTSVVIDAVLFNGKLIVYSISPIVAVATKLSVPFVTVALTSSDSVEVEASVYVVVVVFVNTTAGATA